MSSGKFFKFKRYKSNEKIVEIFGGTFNNTLMEIKNGNDLLREKFIREYIPFIIKATSSTIGKYVDIKNNDEFSIALEAFNEAIDDYDFSKNVSFFVFAEMVISRRLINFMKRSNNLKKEFFFNDLNSKEMKIIEDTTQFRPFPELEEYEEKEEILKLEKKLAEFKISLWDLVENRPKHRDTIALCINIARTLADDNELYHKLIKNKSIPRKELLKKVNVHRRTIENNRKMIIALCLILKSELNNSKLCLKYLEKGGWT